MADIETDRIPFLPKISKTSRLRNRLKSLATTTFAYMFCVLMGLAVGVVWTSQQYTDPTIEMTFELDQAFIGPPSPVSDRAWNSLVPVGRGFVAVDAMQRPVVHRINETEPARIRTVSVYHQLHCLNELRIGYYAAHRAQEIDTNKKVVPPLGHKHLPAHMEHCFDYIRQALMCAADSTLEMLRPATPHGQPSVDGWGTEHRCRNFQELSQWTETHRATDAGGIL